MSSKVINNCERGVYWQPTRGHPATSSIIRRNISQPITSKPIVFHHSNDHKTMNAIPNLLKIAK